MQWSKINLCYELTVKNFPKTNSVLPGNINFEISFGQETSDLTSTSFDGLKNCWISKNWTKRNSNFSYSINVSCRIEIFIALNGIEQLAKRNEIENIFNSRFSDVTLVVKDQEFKVHKAILSERSPYFEAMFHTNMKEKSLDKIEIKDIEPEILKELLIFIYLNRMISNNNAIKIFVAADQVIFFDLSLKSFKMFLFFSLVWII